MKGQISYEEIMAIFAPPNGGAFFRKIAQLIPLSAFITENEAARNALLVAATFEDWKFGFEEKNYSSNLHDAIQFFSSPKRISLLLESEFSHKGLKKLVGSRKYRAR
jgi:hypothetical protein